MSNPKRSYKRYLQPDSVETIPSSTWYRNKKSRRKNVSEDIKKQIKQ